MSPRYLPRKLILFSAILAVIFASGCGAPSEVKVKIDGNRTVGLRLGQDLKIELEGNPTTGYLWQVAGFSNENILEKVGKYEYVRKSDLIGAGGVQTFSFKSLKKGTTVISFEYTRAWETNKAAEKQYNVKVVVH